MGWFGITGIPILLILFAPLVVVFLLYLFGGKQKWNIGFRPIVWGVVVQLAWLALILYAIGRAIFGPGSMMSTIG